MSNRNNQDTSTRSIVALSQFIQSTRDSGYKSTVSAVSELVDNALQAKAGNVDIAFVQTKANGVSNGLEVIVTDDGTGMNKAELQHALRFGGSSRFNDRSGLGRYGMGLPNASLSQCRRVEVWSWKKSKSKCLYSYLDVDDVVSGKQSDIRVSRPIKLKHKLFPMFSSSGTLVHWKNCDRVDFQRISTLTRKLDTALGRMFRHFLWSGVNIRVNGHALTGRDPLYLQPNDKLNSATLFNEPLELEIRSNFDDIDIADKGIVRVQFSELPISKWQGLPNAEKRKMGIVNGAGVSIVRNQREIDYGWFFMGKRKENYDDWWRCEIQFEPILDDVFGITHTKQQIHPHPELRELLEAYLSPTANALNARARDKHRTEKLKSYSTDSETLAYRVDSKLKPVPKRTGRITDREKRALEVATEALGISTNHEEATNYRIVDGDPSDPAFFTPIIDGNRVIIVINRQHRFYKTTYLPLINGDLSIEQCQLAVQKLLIASARAELQATSTAAKKELVRYRDDWSEALGAYL